MRQAERNKEYSKIPRRAVKELDLFSASTENEFMNFSRADSFKMWAADDSAYGPVNVTTLIEWIEDGRVAPDTFLQPQSDFRWRRAADVEPLREKFPSAKGGGVLSSGEELLRTAALGEFALFAGLSDAGLTQLAALGKFYEAPPGTVIVQTGEPSDAVYFVLSGGLRVRLIIGIVDRQDRTLCKLESGEIFGELGMFLQSKRTADVIAETESRLFRMTNNAFRLLVHQIPEFAAPVLFNCGRAMARRIADDNQRFYHEVTSQFNWV